jgi:hypothetical protein
MFQVNGHMEIRFDWKQATVIRGSMRKLPLGKSLSVLVDIKGSFWIE